MHGGHWKAQLRAQWEASRRRADAGAQTDALYADAGAQTTRPAYSDGGAQTLLGADDEDARPAPSYASDDDDALVARIAAPPAVLASKVIAEPPALGKLTHAQQDDPAVVVVNAKSAAARRGPPRGGAPAQTPATASAPGTPTTGKGAPHSPSSHPPTSSQNLHMGRSPPPPYAPPAPPSPIANFTPAASPSASSPSRSRKAVSPPVPKLSALPAAPDVAPPPPPRERLFIRIPARKRPPAPAPAVEPDLPAEQLASPVPSPASAQVLVQSPLPPPSVVGRKRPRSKEAASPAKRALTALDAHTTDVSEPVAGPSRLAEPVAVESVSPVRAKRQMKTAKSRVAPLPPPMKTAAAVASSATVASSAAERAASSSAQPVQARARQWPSLSTALTPVAPASLSEDEPVGRTMSIAEALAAPTLVEQALSAPTPVEQALAAPPVAVEQARPLVPRKRTRSPSAERALAPTREAARAADEDGAAPAARVAADDVSLPLPGTQLRSPATASRLAHVEAQQECIPDRTSDLAYLPSVADVQAAHAVAAAPAIATRTGASPDARSGPAARATLDSLLIPADDLHAPATGAFAMNSPPERASTLSVNGASVAREAAPEHPLPPPVPASTSPVARPKIKLRLKLPRAPSPPVRDKTESPLGLCFPSPPAPLTQVPAVPKPVPAELLAAFGGPGEEEEEEAIRALEAGVPVSGSGSPVDLARAPDADAEELGQHGDAQDMAQSPARESTLPLQKSVLLSEEPATLVDDHARAGTEQGLEAPPPRSPSTPRTHTPLLEDPRADAPGPASAVSSHGGADVDMDMGGPEDGAPSPPPAGYSATVPRALSSRADSPAPLSAASSPGGQDVHMDVDMDMDMDMGMDMGMVEEDGAPARLASPPPAVPSATIPRKRARTPLPDQRALSSPRRSSTPISPYPALALDSFHSPPPLQPSPHPVRSSPQPSPAPMSPPWSPVALPDEMMQLLALGAGPLPMPVFEPLPAPPPDEEEDGVFGSDEDVERLLDGVPPPPPTGEKKAAKKRKRRASGKRKSRAVVGDSD